MNCGCDYCTEKICELEELFKTNKNIYKIDISRTVNVTLTSKKELTEQERNEIYELEGKAVSYLSIDGLDFRLKAPPKKPLSRLYPEKQISIADYYKHTPKGCLRCIKLLSRGAQPERLGTQICGCLWQINDEQSIIYKRKSK